MGSWGVGLYQNDVGLDVRGTYRDCRKMGFRGDELAAIVRDGAALGDAPKARTRSSAIWRWPTCCGRTGCCPRRCGRRRCA
jgi:hypothetical protein